MASARIVTNEDRGKRVQAVRDGLAASRGGEARAGWAGNERVRIAAALLRFGRSVTDPRVMVDALLAAASQTATEQGIDPAAIQDDLAAFLAAAREDATEEGSGEPRPAVSPETADGGSTRRISTNHDVN